MPRLRALTPVRGTALAVAILLLATVAWLVGPRWWRHNLHPVIPGAVYRSGQPSAQALESWIEELRLRSVLNLRGESRDDWYRAERAVLDAHELPFSSLRLTARRLPSPRSLRELLRLLEASPRPLLLHCGGGADRSGLASALVLLLEGAAPDEARAQLGLRYGHLGALAGSDLGDLIDQYGDWLRRERLVPSARALHRFAAEGYVPEFYAAHIEPLELPARLAAGEPHTLAFRVTNASPKPWRFTPTGGAGVHLGAHLESLDAPAAAPRELRGATPDRRLEPGERIVLPLRLPPLAPGRYRLRVDLVDEFEAWFADMGSEPLIVELEARRESPGSASGSAARSHAAWASPKRAASTSRTRATIRCGSTPCARSRRSARARPRCARARNASVTGATRSRWKWRSACSGGCASTRTRTKASSSRQRACHGP